MTGGKKIASYSLSPEGRGEVDYVDTSIACYYRYECSYCMEKFYLVDPYTKRSGGCAQRLILRNKNTNERIPTNTVHSMCISCFHDIMRRQVQERS